MLFMLKNMSFTLAYAMSVHKSQGSEYPAVVIPLLSGPKKLLSRNLLYTAVTRAKNTVCILGSSQTLYSMVDNEQQLKRYTGLRDRIEEFFNSGGSKFKYSCHHRIMASFLFLHIYYIFLFERDRITTDM